MSLLKIKILTRRQLQYKKTYYYVISKIFQLICSISKLLFMPDSIFPHPQVLMHSALSIKPGKSGIRLIISAEVFKAVSIVDLGLFKFLTNLPKQV